MTPQKNIFCHIFFLLIFVPNWHEKLKIIFLSETAWNWKKLRKQNQSGIKFYYMWSKEFKVINSLTEISQNVDFPHFPLFEIIALMWSTAPNWNGDLNFSKWQRSEFLQTSDKVLHVFKTWEISDLDPPFWKIDAFSFPRSK